MLFNQELGFGGDDGVRTHDLCSAIAALSPLSYIPLKHYDTQSRSYLMVDVPKVSLCEHEEGIECNV